MMMMSSLEIDENLIQSWNNASDSLNRYFPIFIYTFGITGNLLNILVLSQRPLRLNPSALFFMFSSISGLIALLSGLTTRMMAGYSTDMTTTIDWICKIRNYVLYSARTITLWSITFATIDRWLASSTNVHKRQLSTLKNAQRSLFIVHIYAILLNVPILYCYQANLTGILRGCYGATYSCRLITDFIYTIATTLFPLILMIIFGCLTIQNIRQTRQRILNVTMIKMSDERPTTMVHIHGKHNKKTEKHLLEMLGVQVTLLVILTFPHG
ncbi:unnamed protein product, partial [Adineta ricciae]